MELGASEGIIGSRWLRAGLISLGLAAGLLHGFAFGDEHAGLMQALAFILFSASALLLVSQQKWGLTLPLTLGFWWLCYVGSMRWMAEALTSSGALGGVLGSLVYAALTAVLSSVQGLCMGCTLYAIRRVRNGVLACAALSSSVLIGDMARESLLPSFPWVSVAYTQTDSFFSALFPLTGAMGVGWIILFVEAMIALVIVDLIRHRSVSRVNILALGVIALCGAGAWWIAPTLTHASTPLRVAVMQTAISTREKFSRRLLLNHVDEIAHFAQGREAQLVITPETAVPTILQTLPSVSSAQLMERATATRALILGAFAQDSRGEIYNSAILLQRDPQVLGGVRQSTSIKQHLAPIGEYSPRGLRWLVELLDLRVPQLQVTQDSRATFHLFGVTVVPSICQDLLYGNDLRVIDNSPRLLVNLSNFSFFSSSLARRQFIDIARTRALEQQVPVVVASNLGPSVFVNADGTVAAQLPPDAAGALEFTVRSRNGMTPYVRTGDLFSYLVIGITACGAPLYAWRRRDSSLVTAGRSGG